MSSDCSTSSTWEKKRNSLRKKAFHFVYTLNKLDLIEGNYFLEEGDTLRVRAGDHAGKLIALIWKSIDEKRKSV